MRTPPDANSFSVGTRSTNVETMPAALRDSPAQPRADDAYPPAMWTLALSKTAYVIREPRRVSWTHPTLVKTQSPLAQMQLRQNRMLSGSPAPLTGIANRLFARMADTSRPQRLPKRVQSAPNLAAPRANAEPASPVRTLAKELATVHRSLHSIAKHKEPKAAAPAALRQAIASPVCARTFAVSTRAVQRHNAAHRASVGSTRSAACGVGIASLRPVPQPRARSLSAATMLAAKMACVPAILPSAASLAAATTSASRRGAAFRIVPISLQPSPPSSHSTVSAPALPATPRQAAAPATPIVFPATAKTKNAQSPAVSTVTAGPATRVAPTVQGHCHAASPLRRLDRERHPCV
jgi:hypothetical protein